MHQAIRIEHPSTEKGCFCHKDDNYSMTVILNTSGHSLHSMSYRHNRDFPTPWEEGFKREDQHHCAFKSIEQAQQWVTENEFKLLCNTYGFRIYLLELSHCHVLTHQTVFEKEHILDRKDITSLFTN